MNAPTGVSAHDRRVLRELARGVAEIGALPIQQARVRLWKALNALRPQRPLVAVYPERAWAELLPDSVLRCQDPALRAWERRLRQTLWHHEHIPDDRPLLAEFLVGWEILRGDNGIDVRVISPEGEGPKAVRWDPPVKSMADLENRHVSEVVVDRVATQAWLELATDLFGGILEVRLAGGLPWWSVGISRLAQYHGLQEAMLDMYERPQLLHAILSFQLDDQMHFMDVLERENVLTLNNGGIRIDEFVGSGHEGFTDGLPVSDFAGRVRWKDLWGLGEMQEFSGVGPGLFQEFSLQYQLPLLRRFGLVDYGCCEPLDAVYDLLLRDVPRLRRLSVTSPYADKRVAADKLGDRYIFSWKPNPTPIATGIVDWAGVEADIRETLDVARGCCLEMVMKSTETFRHEPERVTRWAGLARRLAEEHAT